MWNGGIDDRCLYCAEFIEPRRLPREVETKLRREVKRENDFFAIKPGDSEATRLYKQTMNGIRWLMYYGQMAFFIFISFLLVLLSLLAG